MALLALGDRVTFINGLPDEEYAQLLASAEVAVIPSLYEGFSLPAVEHMASGTPLVASRAGALPEVIGDAAAAGASRATRRSWPPRCADCSTTAPGARNWRLAAWPGCASGSPGPRSPTATAALYLKAINGELGC